MMSLYKLAICSLRFAYFRTQGLPSSIREISTPAFGTMSVPSTHRALTVVERGDQATNKPGRVEVQERPVPTLRENGVLVRVKSVALNPTDWKVIPSPFTPSIFIVWLLRKTDAFPYNYSKYALNTQFRCSSSMSIGCCLKAQASAVTLPGPSPQSGKRPRTRVSK